MSKTVFFFRGRNTANIIADATRLGLLEPEDRIAIVCRENDSLAEPGDVTEIPGVEGPVVVVANGGTTAQQVPVVAWAVSRSGIRGYDDPERRLGYTVGSAYYGPPSWIVEVARDEIITLWGGLTEESCV